MGAATPEEAVMSTTVSNLESRTDARASRREPASPCCGGPAPEGADACCARDAEVKSAGGGGCGCNSASPAPEPAHPRSGCCG